MFKTFGTEEAVFVNQDEGMFVAFPYTFDEAAATLETETIGGRKYVKAGSLVKEGDIVKGITAEAYDITHGPKVGRVVLEGYAWASRLTPAALAAAASLPRIVLMPYTAAVVTLEGTRGLVATLKIEGAKFAAAAELEDFTVSGKPLSKISAPSADGNSIEIFFSDAGDVSVTAIAADALTMPTGTGLKGLPLAFTVAKGTAHAITVTAGANGTAAADKQTAAEGEIVTITATPSSGYVVDKVKVDGVDLEADAEDAYKFVMKDAAVAVAVTFKAQG